MLKNGLFIASIGLIFFVFSTNSVTGEYNLANLITSVMIILIGAAVAYTGHKRKKEKGEKNDDN